MAVIQASYTDLDAPLHTVQPHGTSRHRSDPAETFTLTPPQWHADAACKGYPTDWWFPERGETGNHTLQAKKICETCPVKTECLADAMLQGPYCVGVWGGLSAKERGQLRGKGKRPGPKPKERHGTCYRYDRYKCRCDLCKAAHMRAQDRYRARKNQQKRAA